MVKSYRKYEHAETFGTVTSGLSNVVWSTSESVTGIRDAGAGQAYVGANEEVLCWDVKTGGLLNRWRDSECGAEVTSISRSRAEEDIFAVGYSDGSIRIWDSRTINVLLSFNGHRSAITHLVFDQTGSRLASGSRDTDIIIWNLVSELAEFKLRGHKDQITGIQFIQTRRKFSEEPHSDEGVELASSDEDESFEESFLLSTSKDALIKIWDISTPHCIETHVAQTSGECWALGVSSDGRGCITAGNDGELKVWSLDLDGLAEAALRTTEKKGQQYLHEQGNLHRQGKDRTVGITFHPRLDYFAVHGSEKAVEVWRIRGEDEIKRHLARKRRRRREKAAASGEIPPGEDGVDPKNTDISSADVTEVFVPDVIVRTSGKVRSLNWIAGKGRKSLHMVIATTNNQMEVYQVTTKEGNKKAASAEPSEYQRTYSVEIPGHRTDIRAIALSSDDRMLVTASTGSLKLWNVLTQSCLRTLDCGQALCCSFLPGDKIVLIGTKTGELELFDIATSTLLDSFQAHDGAIWTLQVHPDGRSVVTGSADKCAKFWNFKIVQEEIPGTTRTTPRLKLVHNRTLKVTDDILSICFSPDSRLLAVSTLDNTVKVFFADSLKLFLNLYGHKLPVLDISISSDSKLIATCSADKNVRLWGLDFGDCHKAFFAHQDSILHVDFIPHPVERDETHLFFSASKDATLKTWDGDKFEQVQKLTGHHGEIWAMAVSRTGEKVITASHDKSIRVWNVTDDFIFLEEERERELEEMYESTLMTSLDRDARANEVDGDPENGTDVAAATQQTMSTLTHGERLLEALEMAHEDLKIMREYDSQKAVNPSTAPPQRNATLMALNVSAEEHILKTISRIPTPALHDALLVLPFSAVPPLFTFIAIFLERRVEPEMVWGVCHFVLKTHHEQIVATKALKMDLMKIQKEFFEWVEEEEARVGFNVAALKWIEKELESKQIGGVEDDDEVEDLPDKGRRKRAFASIV
ncbi:WD40 repeat-like protein [Viridothelium virens]|uniref:WD40 repeat-like protein n=1 Tax=Viridothelium virens TaxID=1048519 RepID=A0A6A6GSA4_VIRVR|nr:WD40 repeat-like protein [Viridothelium virens]